MRKRIAAAATALVLLLTGCGAPSVDWNTVKTELEKGIEERIQQQAEKNGKDERETQNTKPDGTQQEGNSYTWRQETQGPAMKRLLSQAPLYNTNEWLKKYSDYVPDFFSCSTWTTKDYTKSYDFMFMFNTTVEAAVGNVFAYPLGTIPGSGDLQAFFFPAADVEDELKEMVDMIYGDDITQLKNSNYYDKSSNCYMEPQGYGSEGTDYLEAEKVIVIDNYMVILRRHWSDWQRNNFAEKPYPTDEGAVTVMYKDRGDDYYHYLSNYRVKEIDRYLKDPAATNGTVQQPASTESPAIRHVTAEDGLRLRAGAGTNFDAIYTLPYGCPVVVHHAEKDWCYVEFNGTYGWMSSEYLAA